MESAHESLRQLGGPFDIILADPPWRFKSNSEKNPGRNAIGHYGCMELEDIAALPVGEIAAKDALLLLWVTVPFLPQGLDVARAWGFSYKSELVWVKDRPGTGFWARNRHEVVLICRRGKFPCRSKGENAPFPDSVISGQQREHSRKPDALHDMIDAVPQWVDRTSRLEMFARETRPGWTSWGNETTKFDRDTDILGLDDLLDLSPETEPSAADLLAA